MSDYDPSERLSDCPDDDAFEVSAFEVSFAIPSVITQEHSRRFAELVSDIVDAPWNQPKNGVHWPSGCGSKPQWSQADQRVLGMPVDPNAPESGEPDFDDSVYFIETCAREFVSDEERERKARHRAKPRLTEDELRRLLDQASILISQVCGQDYWGKSEDARKRALKWLADNDLMPSPLRNKRKAPTQ
jgi:hypothetical protein